MTRLLIEYCSQMTGLGLNSFSDSKMTDRSMKYFSANKMTHLALK